MDFAQLYAQLALPSHGWLATSMEPSKMFCICGQHQAREGQQHKDLSAEEEKITNDGEETSRDGDRDNGGGGGNTEKKSPEGKPNSSNSGSAAVTVHIAPFFYVELEGEDEDVSQSSGGSVGEMHGERPLSLVDLLVRIPLFIYFVPLFFPLHLCS